MLGMARNFASTTHHPQVHNSDADVEQRHAMQGQLVYGSSKLSLSSMLNAEQADHAACRLDKQAPH